MDPLFNTRMSVNGLRTSDPASLSVLTQDLLRQHLTSIAPETLADLYALSEAVEELPRPLLRDLKLFADQKAREIRDLPDGKHLQGFLDDLAEVPAVMVPSSLREVIEKLLHVDRLAADTQARRTQLLETWADAPPKPLSLKRKPAAVIYHPPTPKSHQSPADQAPRKRQARVAPVSTRAAPASEQDERAIWIRQYVAERLEEYGDRGLKESILVGTASHQAPWPDVSNAEIMTVLRAMKRDGKLRYSAGRWMRVMRFSR